MSPATKQEEKFATLLLRAIDRIAFLQAKKRELVREQLGQDIGRNSSTIDFWIYRKRLPARVDDLEKLVRQIAVLNGWKDEEDCLLFLQNANHPAPHVLLQQLFAQSPAGSVHSSEDTQPNPKSLPAFVVGNPVQYPSQFFGRERELRRIFKALQGHYMQNIAISGAQRSGKTSLLHYLRKITRTNYNLLRPNQYCTWLPTPARYHWAFIDLQDARAHTQEGFFRTVLNRLGLPATPDCSLPLFIDLLSEKIVHPTIILLDEIQVALEIEAFDQEFWWGLRSLVTNQTDGNLCFIVSSQKGPEEFFFQSERPSPFFNIFGQQIALGPLLEEEARQLIGNSPIAFEEAAVEWILQTSHLWPALLQILCQARLYALEEGVPSDESWKQEGLKHMTPYRHLVDSA